jgi:hypothetical protein
LGDAVRVFDDDEDEEAKLRDFVRLVPGLSLALRRLVTSREAALMAAKKAESTTVAT